MTAARSSSTRATPDALPRSRAASVWMRLFWATLFIGHLPAVFAVLSRPEIELARVGLLLGSQLLFVLKALDVAWLRLPDSRRARMACVLVAVLLHADVLTAGAVSRADLRVPPDAAIALQIVVAGVLVILLAFRRAPRDSSDSARVYALRVSRCRLPVPRFLALLRSIGLQRPPPACAR